jgi:U4/U6 small nuclear ribonucleoprotein PRP4
MNNNNFLEIEEQKNKEELSRVQQLKRIARNISIPTNDNEVRVLLNDFKFPESITGENNMERRDRLKKLIGDMILRDGVIPNIRKFNNENLNNNNNKPEENEIFYTEGSDELKNMRIEIAKFSFPRSAYRIEISKKKFMEIDRIQEGKDYEGYLSNMQNYEFVASQFADERGCTKGALSPNNEYYGVSGVSSMSTILSKNKENKNKIKKQNKTKHNKKKK